jgi:hypothetical protein
MPDHKIYLVIRASYKLLYEFQLKFDDVTWLRTKLIFVQLRISHTLIKEERERNEVTYYVTITLCFRIQNGSINKVINDGLCVITHMESGQMLIDLHVALYI